MFGFKLISCLKFGLNLNINNLKAIKCFRLYSQSIESTKQSLDIKVDKINIKNALMSKPSDKLVSISVIISLI